MKVLQTNLGRAHRTHEKKKEVDNPGWITDKNVAVFRKTRTWK